MIDRGDTPKATILVVDDSVENVRLLDRILTSHGYRVRQAPDGAQALKSIASDMTMAIKAYNRVELFLDIFFSLWVLERLLRISRSSHS